MYGHGELNGEKERERFGLPSHVSSLILDTQVNVVKIPPAFRDGVHLYRQPHRVSPVFIRSLK